jgi:hypothetical protein
MGAFVSSGAPAPGVETKWRKWTGPTWLLAAGLVLWLIAQALPGAGEVPVGVIVTLASGLLGLVGMVLESQHGWWLFAMVGWTANFWLLGALVARRRGKPSRALGLSWVALLCALAEVVSIYLLSVLSYINPNPGSGPLVIHTEPKWGYVGLGTWVWLASFFLVIASTWWARRRGESQARTT